jgi:uncharacterized protein YdcH (DUF465 family)
MKPEKKINYTKRSKTNRVKKPLIRGIQNFSRRVKLNWKITLVKGKTNQKNESQTKKIKQQKIWLRDEIESQKSFNKSAKKKN